MPLPPTWLIVCEGNMFRSRATAALLRKSIDAYLESHNAQEVIPSHLFVLLKPQILSAGLYTNIPRHNRLSEYSFYQENEAAFREVFSEFGLDADDLDNAVSQEVTSVMVQRADRIYCFNDADINKLKQKFPDLARWIDLKVERISKLGGEDFDISDPSTNLTPESARAMLGQLKDLVEWRDFLTDIPRRPDRETDEQKRSLE